MLAVIAFEVRKLVFLTTLAVGRKAAQPRAAFKNGGALNGYKAKNPGASQGQTINGRAGRGGQDDEVGGGEAQELCKLSPEF